MRFTPSQLRSTWIDRFVARLDQLHPGVDPATARHYGCEFFDESADLEPEQAARIFVGVDVCETDCSAET